MKGRRVSEMCCGDIFTRVDDIAEAQHLDLLAHTASLSDRDAATVLQEFSMGRNFVQAELQVRLNPFVQLLLKVLCIGHHDVLAARNHMAICLVQWENNTDAQRAHPHHEETAGPRPHEGFSAPVRARARRC